MRLDKNRDRDYHRGLEEKEVDVSMHDNHERRYFYFGYYFGGIGPPAVA